jgi:hypothetical protein
MATTRSVDFLPEIFQTPANKQFLSATLDQLVQEPKFNRTQGFVGRRVGPGVNPEDSYVVEIDQTRANYQLEPGVVRVDATGRQVLDAITYPGINDALRTQGSPVNNSDRLYTSDYYTWDPFVDFDKFVNYSQYYWLPDGPTAVDVFEGGVPTSTQFTVTKTAAGYRFNSQAGVNPIITLVRGGTYTFTVNQTSEFWIQEQPGVSGVLLATPNISSREIVGVINNGTSAGKFDPLIQSVANNGAPGSFDSVPFDVDNTVIFNVPSKSEQQFFFDLPDAGTVDLVTDIKFNEINNIFVSEFLAAYPNGIDGITNLNGRTVILTNQEVNPEDGGWLASTQFDPLLRLDSNNGLAGSYDSLPYDLETVVPPSDRYSVWSIQYATSGNGGAPYIRLVPQRSVANLRKISVLFGTQWSNTQWWKNDLGFWNPVPNLNTLFDTLYYQDGTDPLAFGIIRLIDQDQIDTLNIDDIIGQKVYTSPNGVVFTNNLKVVFRGNVTPELYQNKEFYVSGVGTGTGINERVGFVDGRAYFGPFHVHLGQKMTGAIHVDTFHQFIYDTVEESLANEGAGGPVGAPPPTESAQQKSLGNGIFLIPVSDFVVPEQYIDQDVVDTLDIPDYLVMSLDSPSLSAWSRVNRWFHIDVITATAQYTNSTAVINNEFRAKRPILEYRGGLRLFNMGTKAKQPVNVIDFSESDALSNVNGSTGFSVDGYTLLNGSRVIFAADTDPQVRNKIYVVEFIVADSASTTPIINLTPAEDAEVLIDQSVVTLDGTFNRGVTYYYTGVEWRRAQQKTFRNQAPLFDVFDLDGISFSNNIKYPSTNFVGSKLFSYAVGSGVADSVLGIPLRFLTLTNVGDIVFDNNFYTDSFSYVKDTVGTTEQLSNGVVREYQNRTDFVTDIGWQPAVTKSRIYQQFLFESNTAEPLILDIAVVTDDVVPAVKIYVDGEFQLPGTYTLSVGRNNTVITLAKADQIPNGTDIVVLALSSQTSSVGFYQVPNNLENNPLNENTTRVTLGTARAHYQTIAENLPELEGSVNGANNIRDLGNVIPYGLKILQQSSPVTLAGYFLRSSQFNIFSSLEFNSREYEKLKAQILATAVANDYNNITVPAILDSILEEITSGKTEINSFYWSDMIPSGSVFNETQSTFTSISTRTFDTLRVYNFESANYQGLLVYVNNRLLLRDTDYVVATDGPRLTIISPLSVGDIITIREYADTAGSFVPNTPTKLGLYPAFRPRIYIDSTYIDPVTVIRGHDGSITVGFGDFRDELLLEFERRIYNNLKLDGNPIPLTAADVVPGQFRTTDYSLKEVNEILGRDFLSWVGWNRLDYKTQDYNPLNEFTYNYSAASNKLTNNQPLAVGAWRGIYNFFYDTITPNTTPWQMLGFSEQPDWWENYYGPAPYTSGNLVLWDDLEQGLVRDPNGEYVLEKYRRPGLTSVIPSGGEGELLSPLESVVGNYSSTDFRKSWTVGDDGPTENAWRTSSSYPFAVMRLLALTRPAEFFSLFADRDLYRFDNVVGQYLYNRRYRLDANGVDVYGNGLSLASFINWIVDYNRQAGVDSTERLSDDLQSLSVRLCYRMAGFSAKNLLQLYTEKSSPESTNSGLLLPDESYNLLLYKNVPFETLTYSGVIVQKTDNGFAVFGYSTLTPYFEILKSQPVGNPVTITGGGASVQVSTSHTDQTVSVPYGFVFATAAGVADFLISYGALLQSKGMIFTDIENGYVLNWQQMVTEFLYWTSQAWAVGSVINLNPNATRLLLDRPFSIVDNISLQTQENVVLDQNSRQLSTRDLIIDRQDNRFSVETTNGQTISYVSLKFVSYEHMIVLDNRSIFADLIYDPVTDARQSRIKLVGAVSADWNGQLNAPGFILNQDNVQEWEPLRKYVKGDIVLYKNLYYSARDIVEPSERFVFSQWVRSDFTEIQQGLLPNLANKSDQLANTYSINTANLERNQDLFAYGLIGFRPREYMTALNLDDVSQINLYRQFLGTKGTLQAAELFKFADIGRGVTEFDIYENWAVQRAIYGANANRSYYELQLNEALLKSNPSIIQVVEPGQLSRADQTVQVNNIWKESFKISSPKILTTSTEPINDTALPSAGYVNLEDVDITMFGIEDRDSLNQLIDQIGIDTRIWVAKTNSYDWGVFRCYGLPGFVSEVISNLDTTSTVTFTRQHNLSPGDTIIIKFFDSDVDGAYQVLSTPTTQSVTIAYEFLDDNQISLLGNGIAVGLETLRVAQASDAVTLPESNRLTPGSRIWVDNRGDGLWQVLEKQNVFTTREQLAPTQSVANSGFGVSADQARQNLFAVIGQPQYSQSGAAVFYIKNNLGIYQQTDLQELSAVGARSFGHSVSIGNQNWMAVGAPDSEWEPLDSSVIEQVGFVLVINRFDGSGNFTPTQLLTPPPTKINDACEFGYSVAVSQDQHWLYVGAPGVNRAYVYGLVEVESQSVRYVTTGTTNSFNYSNSIVIDNTDSAVATQQVSVVLDNQQLSNFSINISTGNVELGFTPLPGQTLVISRRSAVEFTADGSTVAYNIGDPLFTVSTVDSFTVFVNGVIQRPNIDYTFVGGVLTLEETDDAGEPYTEGNLILIRTGSYYQFAAEIAPVGSIDPGARFGSSITCTTDGRQVMIGTDRDTVDGVNAAGSVFVYDRAVQKFIVSEPSVTVYEVNTASLTAPISVQLNNRFLINAEENLNGEYVVNGNVVDFFVAPAVGDQIIIDVNAFNFVQKVVADNLFDHGLFGAVVDICSNDCSLYIGAPGDGAVQPQAGSVQRNINQSRVYGTISSPVANPEVNVNDSIRINDIEVVVPANADASQPTVKDLARAINSAGVPNVVASVTTDLTFVGTGLRRDYFVGSVYSSATAFTPQVLVDGVIQIIDVDYEYNNTTETVTFAVAPESNAVITVISGRLVLTTKNRNLRNNQLTVLPGISSAALWQRLEFVTYEFTQTITSPAPSINAQFGSSVVVDTSATTLVVGAPRANTFSETTFDNGAMIFDARATTFSTVLSESGVVYTFDLLSAADSSVDNPDKFVFGQQIFDINSRTNDQFGAAVSYVDQTLLVTVPGADSVDASRSGKANLYINSNNLPAWGPIRQQQPVVDISLINSVFVYDAITGAKTEFFDFIDPLQGKILGAAKQNINFISAVDPAAYNVGQVNNFGKRWGDQHVNEIWWDTDTVRFIDPNQDDIVYASRRWAQLFPGSTVDIYQWIVSDVPPADYEGEGVPKSIESYSVVNEIDVSGVFKTRYYFWVRGINSIASVAGKTLSPVAVGRYIENPRASGIPYVAFINASTTALYNALGFVSAQDTILSIEFDRERTDDTVHVEYELIPDNRADGFLSETLYRKFQDSFCGVDSAGNLVPDLNLRPANRYGVQFRPRQSMFINRFLALENYLSKVNAVLAQFPISETRSFSLLNSQEPQPTSVSGEWDQRVADVEELSYQNLLIVPVGYRYLVESDSTQGGLWTIYEVTAAKTFVSLQLVQVQTFKTNRYWSFIDWYRAGYNPSIRPTIEVNNVGDLETLQVAVGVVVRVRANAQGKFEIYQLQDTGWLRVALQDGTIQFDEELWNYQLGRFGFDVEVFDSQYFDQEPVIETRKIIQAINQELLIDELAIERNRAMVLMFNFVLSEQIAPEWITKTSLIDVDHKIRQLLPFQTFNRDNQEFVIDYIQEVKPYHVQVREFNLIYEGFDIYSGTLTDFDVPAYWKTDLAVPQFVSPVLTPYTLPTARGTGRATTVSDAGPDNSIWQTEPWSFWYQNYLLSIENVSIIDGGSGYSEPPTVRVLGDAIEPAVLTATVSGAGVITAINVVNPGSGYLLTPTIEIDGVGSGAKLYPIMGNSLVRNIKTTLKYDRVQYQSEIVDWQPNVPYDNGTLVRFDNRVWEANNDDSSPVISESFNPATWILVNAGTYQYPGNRETTAVGGPAYPTGLNGLDRTRGYYTPGPNMPGLDLPLLIDGLDYPGVQVAGPLFSQDTGFDVGNFDINPFDNISLGPEGRPTYSPEILDAIYESQFLDSFLGTRVTDINVDGGAFVDTYSSHAPEELVPGSEFDTLDFKVFTTPGADWTGDGHGWPTKTVNVVLDSMNISFADLIEVPIAVKLVNQTRRISLNEVVDYVINWPEQTVSVSPVDAAPGDVIQLTVYGIGGGNQLFKQSYNGSDIGRSLFIPVTFDLITQTVVFVNGVFDENYGIFPENSGTLMQFDRTLDINDFVTITLISDSPIIIPTIEPFDSVPFDSASAPAEPGSFDFSGLAETGDVLAFGWSSAITEYFVAESSTSTTFTLTNNFLGTNRAVAIVEKNGVRATPPAGAEYIADGSLAYELPNRIGVSQEDILDTDVLVWVNNELQELGVDYVIETFTPGDGREVIFTTAPASGSQILIFVTTQANYIITPGSLTSTLTWRNGFGLDLVTGDVIAVTSWNATDQQNILTRVFVGPVTEGITLVEGYDTTNFDVGTVSGTAGSFDYSEGIVVSVNNFDLGRIITNASRLWVTLNGFRLFAGQDFNINGQQLTLASGVITAADTVVITMFTDNIVPDALVFRIFQDMRGVQATYRITSSTTTELADTLLPTDDVVRVRSAAALAVPDLNNNIWAVLTVNGERILYREIDFVNNTVSSLLRGTAGTAIAAHAAGSTVYNLSRINLAPAEYQDRLVTARYLSDGVETEFELDIDLASFVGIKDISNPTPPPDEIPWPVLDAIEVYVGGVLQPKSSYFVPNISPVTVIFDDSPAEGQEIVIVVRQGLSWYEPGVNTASNGKPLQETDTIAARFFRGLY